MLFAHTKTGSRKPIKSLLFFSLVFFVCAITTHYINEGPSKRTISENPDRKYRIKNGEEIFFVYVVCESETNASETKFERP
jgi:hypothetical protein